ncbi:PREDICTED: uncharacterized protein LOC104811997 isoform X2 [Tarenaya hassleriana]|uniref:uncharacterized protein LOC104811997 isoform X2 n=1 Tax=Tarenaya hassleriana TaxID=28532 RepID=UPI00053C3A82|nr:PREDICTED: uncharacterized protein LOC104811997 isoform X2 [Tarenaya hassleriana]
MAEALVSGHGHQTKLLESPDREKNCEFCVLPKLAVYHCIECDANLCGDCFKIPREISHNRHQGHVVRLTLTPKLYELSEDEPYYHGLYFLICKECHYISYPRGSYRCDKCEFCMCVECVISTRTKIPLGWESNEEFRHWSDVHKLVRCRFREYSLVVEKFPYNCIVCELSMWGTGYACPELRCNKFIHESCISTPRVMRHPLHPYHPLINYCHDFTLRSKYQKCEACRQVLLTQLLPTYTCNECEFALHFQCAISILRPVKLGFHEHSLEYFHVGCVSVPIEWKHEHHEHKLKLMDGSISEASHHKYIQSEYSCDICEGMIKKAANVHVYGCNVCKFYAHFECVLSKKDGLKLVSSSFWVENHNQTEGSNGSNYPSIPMVPIIHDHPLRLQNGSNKLCGMCNLRINGQAYACDDCHDDGAFWVHKECGELPQTLVDHPLHPLHNLHLIRESSMDICVCDICGDAFQGFHFYCRPCEFSMDVKCAFVSKAGQSFYGKHGGKTLRHPFHCSHELTLANFSTHRPLTIKCHMCLEELLDLSYVCKRCYWNCGFHKACMEWPRSVEGHPMAPHHLLQLHQTEWWRRPGRVQCFACGDRNSLMFCYEAVDSERGLCFYHLECGTSLARPLQRGGLPHILYHLPNPPSKGIYRARPPNNPRCASCRQKVMGSYYQCLKCSLEFHVECLRKAKWLPSTAKHEQHVHPLSLKEYVHYGGYYCDICEEPRDPRHPCYACDDCEFVVHMECIVSEENASNVKLEKIEGDDVVKIQECCTFIFTDS